MSEPTQQQKDTKIAGGVLGGCLGFVVLCVLLVWGVSTCSGPSSSVTTTADAQPDAAVTDTPDTPNPHPTTYAQSRAAAKKDFLTGVDESISGDMIAGNKFKYVGKEVDLHCTVDDIPAADWFNATCGDSTIVVQYDASSLAPGQAVRVLGTVQEPMEGNNAMGGNASFPTVQAEFME